METSVKFFQDYQHKHPINFRKASNKIIAHLVEILSKEWEDAVLSNYELRLFINLIAIVDLFFLNFITELIKDGKDEKSLKYAQDCINELRTMKIEILDNELFPKALTELKNKSQDLPWYDESIHEEFVNEVKKEIKDYDSKSD